MPAAPTNSRGRVHVVALAALSAAAFVYVTSETLPVGLLPQISSDLSVSEGRTGLLLSFYALVAGGTAIPFTAWTTHLPRHHLLVAVLGVFVLSQIGAALAPSFWWLVAARLLCALGHGLFWSILAPVAARLAPAGQEGRATAIVFMGNSLALVVGLPLGTLLGQLAGWRAAFLVVGGGGALTLVALWRLLPALPGADDSGFSRDLLARVAERRLIALYVVTLAVVVGQFTAYSYIAPLVREHGGYVGTGYGILLLGYGAAGLAGIVLSARVIDVRPRLAFVLPTTTIVLALTLLGLIGRSPVLTAVAVIAWGGAFTTLPVVLQSSVLRVAPAVSDVASAVYVVAFQIGIGAGALIGGVLVDGAKLDSTPWCAAGAAVIALGVGLVGRGLFPSRHHQPGDVPNARGSAGPSDHSHPPEFRVR
ncbi:MFS transporter [Jatrophihabitans telluris]|uniref:MFS transporter n=1 Tax=Jatrophihabitans telluris TaxID=2038343 RepID=A0ABY4R2C8_9ACTN|nr:MFS transporter [Jatrophihabitans telluris]UQX89295.1 MFS transporter [Jatrophihabitans telluris]